MRAALPNASIMVHQPSGGYQGQATDILIHAQFTEKLKRRLNEIYVKHTGQDYDVIDQALERDNFMSVEQAKDFGHDRLDLPEAGGAGCVSKIRRVKVAGSEWLSVTFLSL